ncbi:MAG: NHLP family bacteriocin export ABC transporter peptidase/permease/ATPase subunit [Anaerolineae bacterium]|nr:NHLP family bacteriocin export ABC transporter peptidase/permease/ATPase subunit [Anaerolineae bacterium]
MATFFKKPHPRPARRVRTPTVLQMEAAECGAAALGSVLGYHGRYVPLEELRQVCGVSRDGSKASYIVKAARQYGLEARGFRQEPAALRTLPLPLIVFWNFNHFVVVEGFGTSQVYLNDPASGPRTVSTAEFDQAFTGVVLTFEPGPDFKRGGVRPSAMRGLRQRLRGSAGALTYVALTGLALVVPGLLVPTFGRVFVDYYLVQGFHHWITVLLVGLALTAAMQGVLSWLQLRYLLRLETKLALAMSSRFLWHVLHLPVTFFSQRYGGEVGARVALNDRVAQLLSGELAAAIVNVALVVFYALLMARYDVALTAISLTVAVLNLVGLQVISRRRADAHQQLLNQGGKLMGTALSGLQIIETLKATGRESDFFARWAGHQAGLVNVEQRLGRLSQVLAVLPSFLSALNTVAILIIGGLRIMGGHLSMGEFVAFQALVVGFMTPINQLVKLGGTIQEVQGDLKRLDDVLCHPPDPQIAPTAGTPETSRKLSGHVEVRNVTFGYNPQLPPLLEDFNLTLTPGARVALVGASGSGKSTVSRLVAGLYEPWSGEILFDAQPRSNLPRDVLAASLAMVDQDIFLFAGSVRDNLTLWDKNVAEMTVVRAARDALIHEEISTKPGGYDYVIQEGGHNFSGGERQRLELARALVGDPTILILDEATSALDALTEQLIDEHLRRRGCTCLIVAHRLSTIRDCDEILVLERGRVVQRGTHTELLKDRDGLYAQLIRAQTPDKAQSPLERLDL